MRLVINHLTRMRHPYICVAGVDESRAHRRPVLSSGRLDRELLRTRGGMFSLGTIVDLGAVQPRPIAPEVEDVVFDPDKAVVEGELGPEEFVGLLEEVAVDSLSDALGAELSKKSSTAAAVPAGTGNASLGVLRLSAGELSSGLSFGKHDLRLRFADPTFGDLSIKVTDLRLWKSDQTAPAAEAIQAIGNNLDQCLVAVGLTRPFQVSSHAGVWHWLQINNVFPREDPLWARE